MTDDRARLGALSGVRVVEVANFIAGPLTGSLLADLGADVVKVESPPERGDPFRVWSEGLYSPHFQAYNRGKRSVALDLRSPEGVDALREVTGHADVVLHNLRPSAAEATGLTYPELSARNPKVILCSISAFGTEGPLRSEPGFDTMGQALSGLLSLLVDQENPRPVGPAMADQLTGLFAAYGVMGALLQRQATGLGQEITTSLLAAAVSFIAEPLISALAGGPEPDRFTRVAASQAFTFRCASGDLLAIHLSSPQKFWEHLCHAASVPHLLDDERFASRAARIAHYDELNRELTPVFARHDRSWWLARLRSFEVPCAPVHMVTEVPDDEQVRALGLIRRSPGPEGTLAVSVANPIAGDVCLPELHPAPLLGADTVEVLREFGYGTDRINHLLATGVAVGHSHA